MKEIADDDSLGYTQKEQLVLSTEIVALMRWIRQHEQTEAEVRGAGGSGAEDTLRAMLQQFGDNIDTQEAREAVSDAALTLESTDASKLFRKELAEASKEEHPRGQLRARAVAINKYLSDVISDLPNTATRIEFVDSLFDHLSMPEQGDGILSQLFLRALRARWSRRARKNEDFFADEQKYG